MTPVEALESYLLLIEQEALTEIDADPLTLRQRLRGLRYTLRFEMRWHTKCRGFWFTPSSGVTLRLHSCRRLRWHGGVHVDRSGVSGSPEETA